MRWLSTLAIVAVFVFASWAVGRALGWNVSLGSSLVASLVLTVLLNGILGLFRRR